MDALEEELRRLRIKELIDIYGEVFICAWCDRIYLKKGQCKCGKEVLAKAI